MVLKGIKYFAVRLFENPQGLDELGVVGVLWLLDGLTGRKPWTSSGEIQSSPVEGKHCEFVRRPLVGADLGDGLDGDCGSWRCGPPGVTGLPP